MAKRGGSGGAFALWGLGVLVAALIVSWGWTTFGPHTRGARRSGKHVVRVQVLNGSGEPGVGTRVAAYLREGGFRVTMSGTPIAPTTSPRSWWPGGGPFPRARSVHYLGGPPLVRQEWSSELADVSVVLIGSDRSKLMIEP